MTISYNRPPFAEGEPHPENPEKTTKQDGIAGKSVSNPMAGRIVTAIFCRLVLNTSRRFVYPFAPLLSRGLGVSLTAVTSLIAVNQATALIGVIFGPVSDRLGYRLMMMCGMALLVSGMLWTGISPSYGALLLALFLAGLGKTIFDPAIQAYVSRHVPYRRRGLAIGLLETSWAGSTLLGIPAIALLINWTGWRAPFFVLGALGLAALIGVWSLIPAEPRTGAATGAPGVFGAWGRLLKARPAAGALAYAFFISAANDNLFVIYGAWMERSFDISVVALGVGTGVIGIAELCGEGFTALFADRLGLRRSVYLGALCTVAGYLALPFCGDHLSSALTGVFFVFLAFEFTIVTSISFSTELMPGHRATMMSAFFAAAGAGRVAGALSGGPVWLVGGLRATCVVSATLTFLALVSLWFGLKGMKA